jgi:tetratricopeptide (TPR) repeat protein
MTDNDLSNSVSAAPDASGGNRPLAESLLQKALDHYDREEFQLAVICCRQAIAADPSFVSAYNNLGMALIDLQLYDEAIQYLHSALCLDPNSPEAYNNLGFVLRRQGRELEAAAAYVKFLALSPDVEEGPRIRQWIQDICAQLGLSEPPAFVIPGTESSEPQIPTSTEPKPFAIPDPEVSPEVTLKIAKEPAWLSGVQAEAPPAAPETLLKVEAPLPTPVSPSDTEDVKDEHPLPAAATPSPVPAPPSFSPEEKRIETGLDALAEGRTEEAALIFEDVLTSSPEEAEALNGLGVARIRGGRCEEAVVLLQKAGAAAPDDPASFFQLGLALRALDRNLEAAEAYQRFLQLMPKAEGAEEIRAWAAHIKGVSASGKNEAVTLADPLYRKAMELFHNGDFEGAEKAAIETLQGNAACHQARVLLGRVYLRREAAAQAVEQFEGALITAPEDPEALYFLGQAHEKQNNAVQARDAFMRCLAVTPGGVRADRLREWLRKHEEATAAENDKVQCEFCLRRFLPTEMGEHDGKQTCRGCRNLLGGVEPTAEERKKASLPNQTTIETSPPVASKTKIKRSGLLVAVVAVVLLALGALYFMGFFGEKSRPPEIIRLEPSPEALTAKALATVKLEAPGDEEPIFPLKTWERRVRLVGLDKPKDWRIEFELKNAPADARVENETGIISWTPSVESCAFWTNDEAVEFEVIAKIALAAGTAAPVVKGPAKIRLLRRWGWVLDPQLRPLNLDEGVTLCSTVGDINRDGRDDLILSEGSWREGSLRLFLQRVDDPLPAPLILSRGSFGPAVASDADGDGKLDIVALSRRTNRIVLFRQTADGGLSGEVSFPVPAGAAALTVFHSTGKKRPDFFVFSGLNRVLTRLSFTEDDVADSMELTGGGPHSRILPWTSVKMGEGILAVTPTAEQPLHFAPFHDGKPGKPRSFALSGDGLIVGALSLNERRSAEISLRDQDADDQAPLAKTKEGNGERPSSAGPLGARRLALLWAAPNAEVHLYDETDDGFTLAAAEKPLIIPEPPCGFLAIDLNDDGADDLLIATPSGLRVFLRDAERWVAGPEFFGIGRPLGVIAAMDLNQDRRPDFLAITDEGLRVFRSLSPTANVKTISFNAARRSPVSAPEKSATRVGSQSGDSAAGKTSP